MIICFDKDFYPKEALLKAAYAFSDQAYFHLSQDEVNYIVDFVLKDSATTTEQKLCLKIKNELLAQTVRLQVYHQTKNVREIILARAMASTIVGDSISEIDKAPAHSEDFNMDKILNDWFEKYEE